jgi:hypothetical protein
VVSESPGFVPLRRNTRALVKQIEPSVTLLEFRGRRIICDAELAELYGVPTKHLNQAVKRNRARFPVDFAFQLTSLDVDALRSQFVTSSCAQDRASSPEVRHGGRRHLLWVFTEHGALMAANVLRSERAAQMSIFVVRAFVRLRERTAAGELILKRLAEIDQSLLQHDDALRDLYLKLTPLLDPPPDAPRRRIGFHAAYDRCGGDHGSVSPSSSW